MASPIWWTWIWVSSGVGDGQGSLACCSPWGCKVLDTTEQLNRTELIHLSMNMLSPFDYCKWMYKYLFDNLLSVLLDICPEVGLLDCMVAIFLVFWRIAISFFIAAEPFYISTKGFNFSISSLPSFLPPSLLLHLSLFPSLFSSPPLDSSHHGGCEVVKHDGFNLHFPNSDVEHYYVCFVSHSHFFFGEKSVQDLCLLFCVVERQRFFI